MAAAKKTDPTALIKSIIAKDSPPSVLLIIAPDRIRRQRVVEALLQKFAGTNKPKRLTADSITSQSLKSLEQEWLSPSLFSPHQYFVIDGIENLKAQVAAEFADLLKKNTYTGVTVLLTAEAATLTHPLKKLLAKDQSVAEFEALGGPELSRWTERELQRAGIAEFSSGVVEALISLTAGLPDRITSVVQQLALYIDGEKLSENQIYQVFIEEPSPEQYRFLDLMLAGKAGAADLEIQALIESGKSPFALLALIARNLLNITTIRTLKSSGHGSDAIMKLLKMPPWLYTKHEGNAKRYSLGQLRDCADAIVRADSKLKGKSLSPNEVLAELLYQIAA